VYTDTLASSSTTSAYADRAIPAQRGPTSRRAPSGGAAPAQPALRWTSWLADLRINTKILLALGVVSTVAVLVGVVSILQLANLNASAD